MKRIIIITSISALALFSCKKEKAAEPATSTPTPTPVSAKFAADVQPIFAASCGTGGSCHGSGNMADGKVFETHAGASAVPNSSISGSIKHESGFSNLPKSGTKLTDAKIAIIEAWIAGGKLND
jgi:hypothetical protein